MNGGLPATGQRNCTRVVARGTSVRRRGIGRAKTEVDGDGDGDGGMNKHTDVGSCMQMEDRFKGRFREFGKEERGVVTRDILFF